MRVRAECVREVRDKGEGITREGMRSTLHGISEGRNSVPRRARVLPAVLSPPFRQPSAVPIWAARRARTRRRTVGGGGVRRPGGDEVGDAYPPLDSTLAHKPGSGTATGWHNP